MLDPQVVAERPLGVFLYGLGEVSAEAIVPDTQVGVLDWLDQLGFPRPNGWTGRTHDDLVASINELDADRHELDYETDGRSVSSQSAGAAGTMRCHRQGASLGDRLQVRGRTGRSLLRITVQVGRTGALTPVAELEPVLLPADREPCDPP